MKVTVELISRINGFIAARTEHGEFIVLELLGGYDVENGNMISGNLTSLGSETLYNETKREHIKVFVQDIHASIERAKQLLTSQ